MTYLNWNPGEPNNQGDEAVGEMYGFGAWNDLPVANTLPYALYELDSDRAVNLAGSVAGDVMFGGAQGDRLAGLGGTDVLRGKDGADHLLGGTGADLLVGGGGQDTLDGGADADVFQFGSTRASLPGGEDRIADFEQGLDRIDLSAINAVRASTTDAAFTFLGTDPFTLRAGELRFEAAPGGDTRILADTNGDGRADFALLLNGTCDLTAADFVL